MYHLGMASHWKQAQLQATQAMKTYFKTDPQQKSVRARLLFQAQQLVAEALRLDERGPITD